MIGEEERTTQMEPERNLKLPETVESPESRFRRLYNDSYAALFAYALRRCREASDAHDVVADTFLVLWRRLADAPPDSELQLWLYGIARRVLSNRQRTIVRSDRLIARLGQITREETDTEALIEQRAAATAVMRSLARLREDEREILLLSSWERLSTAEIAAVLDCSANAAAIRLHRARKSLNDVFQKENAQTGHEQIKRPQLPRPPDERQNDE
jgi:RNA polymerase sigma factor (sigma-70 family)